MGVEGLKEGKRLGIKGKESKVGKGWEGCVDGLGKHAKYMTYYIL